MKITNNTGLPAPIVAACTPYPPMPERYSVTELVGPAMLGRLRREHWEEIEEDAADRLWAIMGSAMHAILAGHADVNALTEERLREKIGDTWISGQPDLYTEDDGGTVWDYKFTTVYAHGEAVKPEWVGQLNAYAWLLRKQGFPVKAAKVAVVYRDWSKRHEKQGIPRAEVRAVPLYSQDEAEDYIRFRLIDHLDPEPPVCTAEERWERPATYAVMKAGRKTALRVLESLEAAEAWQAANGGDRIDTRPGEAVRCLGYCPVRQWCPYGSTLEAVDAEA